MQAAAAHGRRLLQKKAKTFSLQPIGFKKMPKKFDSDAKAAEGLGKSAEKKD